MNNFFEGIAGLLIAIITIVVVSLLVAYPVKWIWNDIMPSLFNLRQISVGEALELLILISILFSNKSVSSKDK